ncbi:MAG: hypothetical protein JOZ04_16140, partial [Acidimicrobiia bacterium]|nr:hypothetical protein [Acidimicrobiia bacterium]
MADPADRRGCDRHVGRRDRHCHCRGTAGRGVLGHGAPGTDVRGRRRQFGGVKPDPADCIAGAPLEQVYNGPRPFAFEEPYIDLQGAGHYVLGDPFIDCDHSGRWDGNFIGGPRKLPRNVNGNTSPGTEAEDMPYPQYGMTPMLMPHMHARYRFVD